MQSGYVLTVTQLNEYVGSLLQRDALLKGVSVRGEISGFKRHSSGHVYFSLKDGGALIRCVMFRQDAQACAVPMRDGMQAVLKGYASLYVRDGQYQFYVKSVSEEGEGELYRRFLLLKTRLEARGWFDAAHKKPIPALPQCVGIITSPTGAAVRDIVSIARRRFPAMNLLLCPVAVQGVGAADEIAEAIRTMNRMGRADVLIVGRGGGSLEDLWAFNEEVVAEAIFESEIPIVSAVGHETDFSIADFVADLRAPTPSAAAELCVPEYDALLYSLDAKREKLTAAVRAALAAKRAKLEGFSTHGAFTLPAHRLATLRAEVASAQSRMAAQAQAAFAGAEMALESLCTSLAALSPEATLARGFALVRAADGRYVSSIASLAAGDGAELVLHDGRAAITVDQIWRDEEDGAEKTEL